MKIKSIYFIFFAMLFASLAYEMAWAEDKCEALGNTPQECAILSNDVL